MSTLPSALFARSHDDPLNRFYTRMSVGELLVDLLSDFTAEKIVDLGAGQGSLTAATIRRWPRAKKVTVDLDSDCIGHLFKSVYQFPTSEHFHHIHDVFDPDLPRFLSQYGQFDLAVCNPPFFKPPWTSDFARIIHHAAMENACPSVADATAELIFFAQNIRLVRAGGVIAFIAPDGLMTGWRTMPFRKYLLQNHSIQCVVQLPGHSFHDTEARCFVLIVRKGLKKDEPIKLLRYDRGLGLSSPLFVPRDKAELRLDYDFHIAGAELGGETSTLAHLRADVRRGSIGTVQARHWPHAVFHTSDFKRCEGGEITFPHVPLPNEKGLVVAEVGDILMARVDRSLHEKVGLVVRGKAAITDCVYRIRIPGANQRRVLDALLSPSGRAMLKAATKGVSARLLGKADLLNLPLAL